MTNYYGYNATTGHMRPIAHAGELGGDEVLREGREADRDWETWKLRAQIDVLKAENERLRTHFERFKASEIEKYNADLERLRAENERLRSAAIYWQDECGKHEVLKLMRTPMVVTEGWQLVPVEPTPNMVESGYSAYGAGHFTPSIMDCYRAMLAATPKPESKWQSIQTAPTDGREILVWCADTKETFVAIWSAKNQGWQFAIGPKDGAHICRPDLWTALPATPEDSQ